MIELDRRSIRATGIVQRGDVIEVRPHVWRVRDQAGSGQWHYATKTTCDCIDFARNGLPCKHVIAVANWSTKPAGPTCPTCQGPTAEDLLWCGKAGWLRFHVCRANREHRAVRI